MGLRNWLSGKPSIAQFAESVMAGLRAAGDTRSCRYDRDGAHLVCEEDTVDLRGMYTEHCQYSKAERQEHLHRVLKTILLGPPLPEDFKDAAHNLRPQIWSRMIFADSNEDTMPPHHLVGTHLVSTLVYDTGSSVRTISGEELAAWGINYQQALEVAISELTKERLTFVSADVVPIYVSGSTDPFDPARLFLTDFFEELHVQGTPVAMVLDDDHFLLTGSDDIRGQKSILKLVKENHAQVARPMCPLPLSLDDDQWTDWMPDSSHPLYQEFRDFELKILHGFYRGTKTRLQEVYQKRRHVASFSAAQWEG